MKRIAGVHRIESEIAKLKENHQLQVNQLKEQLDKNVRLIESVRQEKLSVQFEVTALRKELSSSKSLHEDREREAEEKIKLLEHQLLDCEINYNSILKEKEDNLSRMQSTLDKHKRSVFEMASLMGVRCEDGADLCAQVKLSVEKLNKENSFLQMETKGSKDELFGLQTQLSDVKRSLEKNFPGINEISELIPIFDEKNALLKVSDPCNIRGPKKMF